MFQKLSVGGFAEALDEFGVRAKCKVLLKEEKAIKVTFPPWMSDFDRCIKNEDEIRVREETKDDKRSRKRKETCSVKVSYVSSKFL